MKVLLRKPYSVIILPEDSFDNSALQRMADIGCKEFISVVPEAVAVLSNITEPIVEEFPVQSIARLGLLEEPFRLFDTNIQPPLS
jgi:hypothetical protein